FVVFYEGDGRADDAHHEECWGHDHYERQALKAAGARMDDSRRRGEKDHSDCAIKRRNRPALSQPTGVCSKSGHNKGAAA
ncbi:hypothetical protein ACC846_38785, partial [Rhizobium ruizarguesonis]